jgi:hypothetical protein
LPCAAPGFFLEGLFNLDNRCPNSQVETGHDLKELGSLASIRCGVTKLSKT